ncbi:DUF6457 domain-containing protein [Cellulomonas carbonis]|uniref:Molybdopterin-guanine dinucleotide biosynthesis protein MobA n=1 Tax=Cellulomonas carbonis T26 TaxID=947969 RepID=A0A0A0BS98_9CELL|nr:DUF6457 domain-containing protein [Cellulomonas carbonis]KGM10775.1 molybdopterin-guanine dinucleotide biosynthesis protein MobA [Cellulomonas carbonis T26]GGB92612.1 hypothetical protein GCM10010972_01640 [Cellulomonas carbonis]
MTDHQPVDGTDHPLADHEPPAPAGAAAHQPVGDDLHRWVLDLVDTLGVDPDAVDIDVLLDLARDVAHAVGRPAVPVTAFLVGCAVGADGGDRVALERAVARVQGRTAVWPGATT